MAILSPKTLGEGPSQTFPVPGSPRHSLVYSSKLQSLFPSSHGHLPSVSVYLSSHDILSLCLCPNFSSYKDTSHNGLRAHTTLVRPHLNLMTSSKNLFQIKSHSQEPGVRTSRYLFRDDTIQPVTDSLYRSDSKDIGK